MWRWSSAWALEAEGEVATDDDDGVSVRLRMPGIERRGSAIVVTCAKCQRFVPVVSETTGEDGLRELEYVCPCGGTSVIVREVR
jgi:hypothetical protein